ncbi:hypothetical protein M3Y99_01766000 [Aphelenchoides fujianensis]|nr:hypothetical protein M3Y99_01766000 [Aphelenchoides fujianensis]
MPINNNRMPYKPMVPNNGKFKPMPEPKPIVPFPSIPIYMTTTSSTFPPTTTTTELPTPAPYTGTFPPPSTSAFLRPSKKPEVEVPTGSDRRINPCPEGKPLANEFDNPMTCNFVVKPNGGCPEDYWCHTGASFSTTTCCPIIKWEDPCHLERSNGVGEDLIPRYFFDPLDGQCKRFLYKGLKGNRNNWITQVHCMEACGAGGSDARSNAVINPCNVGVPARAPDNSIISCVAEDENVCGAGFYCHLGDKGGTCCERTSAEDRCRLPLAKGEGSHQLTRYYYNEVAKKCIEFVYNGLKGNENQFLTYNDCKKTCMSEQPSIRTSSRIPAPTRFDYGERKQCSPISNLCEKGEWCHHGVTEKTCCPGAVDNPCKLPWEAGQGNETLTRWYADPNDHSCNNECKSFTYRGSHGNQNNFLSKELCEAKCKIKQPCDLPVVEGFGDGKLTRFYFNKQDRSCVRFIYRGLGGNQNSFLTQNECRAACPAYDNPCGSGQPLLVDHKPKVCSPNQRCPGTHYCHIGLPEMPNYCCPKNGDPCEQAVSSGTGNGSLRRFYFDKETKACREFVYHGWGGNSNTFLSQEDCELCRPIPCREGTPLIDATTREPAICGGVEECPRDD